MIEANHLSVNQLCIIEGTYCMNGEQEDSNDGANIQSCPLPSIKTQSKAQPEATSLAQIDELVENYKFKLLNSSNDTQTNTFLIMHSIDGGELLSALGLDSIDPVVGNSSNNQRAAALFGSHSSTSYICFLISDFDQSDAKFIKLEESQAKHASLNSLNQTLSSSNSCNTTMSSLMATAAGASNPNSTLNSSNMLAGQYGQLQHQPRRLMIYGWPIIHYCYNNSISLTQVNEIDRPLYCKLMSGCFVCFTGFRKEHKHIVAHCIKLVHYMGGSVRKEYNKRITHLIVKSTLSTKYKTAYNIGRCHLLTEEWIVESWKHRNQIDFNVNSEEFVRAFCSYLTVTALNYDCFLYLGEKVQAQGSLFAEHCVLRFYQRGNPAHDRNHY
jgi:hypothetical protein